MNRVAVAIVSTCAVLAAMGCKRTRERAEPPPTLLVAVPIEQLGHAAPSLVEVWESDARPQQATLVARTSDGAEPVWQRELTTEVDWIAQAGERPPLVRAGPMLVIPSRDMHKSALLVALEIATGQVAWQTPLTSRGFRWRAVTAHGGIVVIVAHTRGGDRIAAAITAATGKLVWQTELAGDDHRVAFHSDFVVFAGTAGAIAMDTASDRRFELTQQPGDLAIHDGALLFVGTSLHTIERRGGAVVLSPVAGPGFPPDAQREVLATCAGMVVRVANKGRGLVGRSATGKGAGWHIPMNEDHDVLPAGASLARGTVLRADEPQPRFLALWIDMGYRPKRGRLATIDCASGVLRWLSGPRAPELVKPPALVAGHYYVAMSAEGGGERAPAGFRYPPDPIALIDGTTGRLANAVTVANGQGQQEAVDVIVPWRVRGGFVFHESGTNGHWSVSPRTCEMGPGDEARTCVSVLPYVHKLLGRPPPHLDH